MEQTSSSRQTPARRGRGGARPNRGRKNYASEGDALFEMPTPASFPTTPMKSNNGSPAPGPGTQQPANSKSTSKKGNNRKSRPNNVSTSPAPPSSQRTPPPSASVIMSSTAFASSSSFHSPAPGSLPRPSFSKFARSQSCVTSSDDAFMKVRSESAAAQLRKEPSPPSSDAESPSPPLPPNLAKDQQHASPLDFLFDAHRADQEKLRRATSAAATMGVDGPFTAPPGSRYPANPEIQDDPIPLKLPIRSMPHRGASDSTGAALGTAPRPEHFVLPAHERLRAAGPAEYRARQSPSQPVQSHLAQYNQPPATPPRLDKSDEVKRLLGIGTPSPRAPQLHHHHQGPYQQGLPQGYRPGPMQGPATTLAMTSPDGGSPGYPQMRGGDLSSGSVDHRKTMAEDALRRALGLNFPVPMSQDGNHSPQHHTNSFSGHA
ncbi:hypothetical protein M406DRAFT_105302 [Cryphonectria parasitica EP155]|uniref:Proteophosphoglycan 5 n=1 Tax=Cryphonectria parasitica (strain ATCC 38755 / EP155) TaxID=660469 RepID=A0A9P4YCE5_CRYP1|nr:uncharacterized protein M406DRAFT_105302 [Cryphonectria parasitica EP155]KAF3770307.1 hypothetical protein M406DRAFT_105302 [Cryphonectria parasitica EP155]